MISNQFQLREIPRQGFRHEPESTFKINFTYESPYMDIKQNIGLNSDSSINVQYTLTSIRDNLLKNIDLLNYLLENSNVISNINPENTDYIGININNELKLKEMIDLHIVCKLDNNSDSQNPVNDYTDDEEEETHSDRLNMICNLLCKSDVDIDSSSDSESDIISDTEKELYICNKYYELIKNIDTDQ
jgi:hypothetical protein